jgi:predicted amidohydrolase
VLDQIDAVFNYFGEKDLIALHAHALHGWDKWTKAELERIALRVPGAQSEAICGRAKQYGCYIAFGGYMVDRDWPGHVIDSMFLASPEGRIVATHWKATTQRGQRPGVDYFVTHVVDVLDAYVERYGADAVLPVARTPIGNIAMSSVFREPELYRALAMKGAEIFVRSGLGGYTQADGELTARTNRAYTLYASNALSPGNPRYFPDNGTLGGTAIFGLRGERLAQAREHETAISATLDVAGRRAQGLIPDISWDLYAPVYAQYRSRFAPNAYAERVPSSLEDASRLLASQRRWKA